MRKKYNICVAGATGFVGSNLVEYILSQNEYERVVCFVRKSSNLQYLKDLPVEIAVVDFSDPNTIRPYLAECDYLFNLIGLTASPVPEKLFKVNKSLSELFLSLYLEYEKKIKGYFYMSTLAVVGPIGNELSAKRQENLYPISNYGKSKLEGEKLLWPYLKNKNIKILRAPAIYGKRDKDMRQYFDIVKKGIAPVVGNGKTKITLINVLELVKFIYRITVENEKRGIFYIYDNNIYSTKDIALISKEVINKKALLLNIPKFLVYIAALINEKVGRNYIFNREKYREMTTSWSYEGNDYNLIGEEPIIDLKKGLGLLFLKNNLPNKKKIIK